MNSFTIKGNADFVKVNFCLAKTAKPLEIKSGNFHVNSSFYGSTGEFYPLYECLKQSNEKLSGKVIYGNYESNFIIIISYDIGGKINVGVTYSEQNPFANKLNYEFDTDQSYISFTIEELKSLVSKYGDMKGKKS